MIFKLARSFNELQDSNMHFGLGKISALPLGDAHLGRVRAILEEGKQRRIHLQALRI